MVLPLRRLLRTMVVSSTCTPLARLERSLLVTCLPLLRELGHRLVQLLSHRWKNILRLKVRLAELLSCTLLRSVLRVVTRVCRVLRLLREGIGRPIVRTPLVTWTNRLGRLNRRWHPLTRLVGRAVKPLLFRLMTRKPLVITLQTPLLLLQSVWPKGSFTSPFLLP